jgi:integrase
MHTFVKYSGKKKKEAPMELDRLEEMADAFLAGIQVTQEGRALYAAALRDFLDLLEARPDLFQDPGVLLRVRQALRERGLRPSTVAFKMTVIRRFLDYLDLREALPPAWIRARAYERAMRGRAREEAAAPPLGPDPDLLGRLLQVLRRRIDGPPRRRARAMRDYALALLLARTGLRVSEALSLRTEDVFAEDGGVRREARIRAKGRQEQWFPLPEDVRRALAAWREALQDLHPRLARRASFVFVSLGRNRLGRLSRQQAWNILTSAAREAGFRASPHDLRRMLARRLLRRGVDLAKVQAVLRHRSPATTLRYARAQPHEIRRALEEAQGEQKD